MPLHKLEKSVPHTGQTFASPQEQHGRQLPRRHCSWIEAVIRRGVDRDAAGGRESGVGAWPSSGARTPPAPSRAHQGKQYEAETEAISEHATVAQDSHRSSGACRGSARGRKHGDIATRSRVQPAATGTAQEDVHHRGHGQEVRQDRGTHCVRRAWFEEGSGALGRVPDPHETRDGPERRGTKAARRGTSEIGRPLSPGHPEEYLGGPAIAAGVGQARGGCGAHQKATTWTRTGRRWWRSQQLQHRSSISPCSALRGTVAERREESIHKGFTETWTIAGHQRNRDEELREKRR